MVGISMMSVATAKNDDDYDEGGDDIDGDGDAGDDNDDNDGGDVGEDVGECRTAEITAASRQQQQQQRQRRVYCACR